MAESEIEVRVDRAFSPFVEAAWLRSIVEQVLAAEATPGPVEVGLVVTGQKAVRELNREYRGMDETTDVLAFALAETRGRSKRFALPPDGVTRLGEVVISYPQAVAQANQHRHPVSHELALLTIHGVLHLLGYDHATPAGATRMRSRERAIMGQVDGLH